MHIPLEFYEKLRDSIKISDVIRRKVALTKKSGEYLGLCPFHTEKTPSFTVNDVKKFYHCFGCSAHGDVVRFIASINGFSYKDAAITLANDYSIEIPQLSKAQKQLYEESDQIYVILQQALDFFKNNLTQNAVDYLASRGVNTNLIKEFDIGFAPGNGSLISFFNSLSTPLIKLSDAGLIGKKQEDKIYEIFHNRIIFPIKNIYNKVVGFGGRVIGDALPKYLNSPETLVFKKNEVLYGEHNALSAAYKKNYIILVEGYLDVISLHNAGFKEVVASLGTAVTHNHIQKLWKYCDEIILALDGDNAGLKASKKVINLVLPLINHEKKISFIKLPANSDPHDVIIKQGAEIFSNLITNRISLSNMIWQMEFSPTRTKTPEAQASLQTELDDYCNKITDKTLAFNYKRFFKDQFWQALFKRNKKQSEDNVSQIDLMEQNISEVELVERRLCVMLIKFPNILIPEYVKNFYLHSNFQTVELADFKWWFFEEFHDSNELTVENIAKKIEITRFYPMYNLLLKSDNLFLDINPKKDVDPILLFEILQKKYYLILLKQECAEIIQHNTSNSFEKFNRYRGEILKISTELQQLEESFPTIKRSV